MHAMDIVKASSCLPFRVFLTKDIAASEGSCVVLKELLAIFVFFEVRREQ